MKEAGMLISSLKNTSHILGKKSNNDIVTQADLLVNEVIKNQMMAHFPDYGWLSEESVDDVKRLSCNKVWIVDPVDGTKEYASGIPEYAISVALVENGIPVLASVYNPATNELFHAIKNGGAWCNDKPVRCADVASHQQLLLLASRSEYERGEWLQVEKQYRVQQVGSIAYKLALIAAGKAQAVFSLGQKNEWDIAAGVLLVTEAGGMVTDLHGKQFQFNHENVLVDGIIATTKSCHDEIVELVKRLNAKQQ